LLTPDFVKLSHNRASDAQASVYLWVGVAIGVYVRAQVGKLGYCLYCLIVNMDCSWSNSSSNILDLRFTPVCVYITTVCLNNQTATMNMM